MSRTRKTLYSVSLKDLRDYRAKVHVALQVLEEAVAIAEEPGEIVMHYTDSLERGTKSLGTGTNDLRLSIELIKAGNPRVADEVELESEIDNVAKRGAAKKKASSSKGKQGKRSTG